MLNNRRNPESQQQTKEHNYNVPILKALVELGGKAHYLKVLELVGIRMADTLNSSDRQVLNDKKATPRWKKRAEFRSISMHREGLLKKDRSQGTWEITAAGREMLSAGLQEDPDNPRKPGQ
jgi:hypothetical protein